MDMDNGVVMACGSRGWDGTKEGHGEKIGTTVIENLKNIKKRK